VTYVKGIKFDKGKESSRWFSISDTIDVEYLRRPFKRIIVEE
jgi:hypothetical protein